MFKLNPKLEGSGIIECIPQTSKCPMNCDDCFFQSGRSYLEPLAENLPHIPSKEMCKGKIVRFNDGNDSNNERELVEKTARQYDNYFFNTAIPKDLEIFSAPVVLTLNPGKLTDTTFYKLESIPKNLMMVRLRTNTWNLETVIIPAIKYYSSKNIMCVLTFMAYYTQSIPENHINNYEWKKRTINSYYCIKSDIQKEIIKKFEDNQYVDYCTKKGQYSCRFCGVCLREYFATKERIK